jgi:hypothetical protein
MSVHLLNEMVSDDFDGFVEGLLEDPDSYLANLTDDQLQNEGTQLLWLALVKAHPDLFCMVPLKKQTREMVQFVLDTPCQVKCELLRFINSAVADDFLCESILFYNDFRHIPDEFKFEKLCVAAVRKVGVRLEQVPAHLQTQEVIDAALERNPRAKKFIKTKRLMMDALDDALSDL